MTISETERSTHPSAAVPFSPLPPKQFTPAPQGIATAPPSSPSEVRFVDVFVDHTDLFSGAARVVSELFPSWPRESLVWKQFTKGITNKLVHCHCTETGQEVLIRIYGMNSEVLIDRGQEIQNITTLSSLGFCPGLYGRFRNGIVYGYIPGAAFQVEQMRDPTLSLKVAETLAEWHGVTIPGSRTPHLFPTLERWICLVPERFEDREVDAKFHARFDMESIRKELAFLKKELKALGSPVVFSHNDLLCGNIVYDDQTDKMSLIDYEYACFNYRGFDIGNHFCEFAGFEGDYTRYPGPEFQRAWLEAYLKASKGVDAVGEEELDAFYEEVNKFSLAAHFFWGVWSLVQAKISDIDFDYMEYAGIRMDEYFKQKAKFFGC